MGDAPYTWRAGRGRTLNGFAMTVGSGCVIQGLKMMTASALTAIPSVGGLAPTVSDPSGSRATAMVQNLLPSANSTLKLPKGVYMGEGIPPVPAKLAAKISNGEHVDMGELLPEFWSVSKEDEGKEAKARRGRKCSPGSSALDRTSRSGARPGNQS